MKEVEALTKILKIYGETSNPVSQEFYQGLCLKAVRTIEQLGVELSRLEKRERLLDALEAGGVDNWEGYGEIDYDDD